ncbi:MAG: hypothetical protein QM817_08190 [Archangium sp.]
MILKALGLSVGEIHVTLERSDYARGDRISGELRLELTEEVEAKRLVVGVRAKQRSIGVGLNSRGNGRSVSYSNDKAFEFAKELSGERVYRDGETAKFELLIPEDGTRPPIKLPEGVLGDITQIVAALASVHRFPLEWRVFAFLDRPWQLNPKGEAQFQLVEAPKPPAAPSKPEATEKPAKKKRAAAAKPKVKKKPAKKRVARARTIAPHRTAE